MQTARKKTELADRRKDVATRYLRGEQQAEIAGALGVDIATISRDLATLRSLWLESAVRDFDAARAQELAKIDAVEREYWEAWERSKQNKEISTQEIGADKKVKKASLRKEGQSGNPAYLDGVLKCIERRCQILGLDAPKRFVIDWDTLAPEQIDQLAAGVPPEKVLSA